jgi:hypothetical protein
MKALAKEPDQRFQNAQEFRAALERIAQPGDLALPVAAPAVAAPAVLSAVSTQEGPAVPEVATPELEPLPPFAIAAAASGTRPVPGFPVPLPAETDESASFFGNTFSSKLGISLAACVLTVLLGSVMLFALLTFAKP